MYKIVQILSIYPFKKKLTKSADRFCGHSSKIEDDCYISKIASDWITLNNTDSRKHSKGH